MKSKKIIAMVLAFASLMAIATSGLAEVAVSTKTTYNLAGDTAKVQIATEVTGLTDNDEVTYLVTSDGQTATANNIVYIDQDTVADGKVSFTYKVAKNKFSPTSGVTVQFGTDGNTPITAPDNGKVAFNGVTVQLAGEYGNSKVALGYGNDATATTEYKGTEDILYLYVTLDDGYELNGDIEGVTVGATGSTYTVNKDTTSITVNVKATSKTPTFETLPEPTVGSENTIPDPDNAGQTIAGKTKTQLIKISDKKEMIETGVVFAGMRFAALADENGTKLTTGNVGVSIQIPDDSPYEDDPFIPYYVIGNDVYTINACSYKGTSYSAGDIIDTVE